MNPPTLLTVFEGALREIIDESILEQPSTKFGPYFNKLLDVEIGEIHKELSKYKYYPSISTNKESIIDHDQHMVLFSVLSRHYDFIYCIKIWFNSVLYLPQDSKSINQEHLNRHNIIHCFKPREHNRGHFYIMILAFLSLIKLQNINCKSHDIFLANQTPDSFILKNKLERLSELGSCIVT